MKPRSREQSIEDKTETETLWRCEGKKKIPEAKVDLKFKCHEGEKGKKFWEIQRLWGVSLSWVRSERRAWLCESEAESEMRRETESV